MAGQLLMTSKAGGRKGCGIPAPAFQLTDIATAAHDWHIDSGLTEVSGKVSAWEDSISATSLSMDTASHRGFKDTVSGFSFLNCQPDPTVKFYTLDGAKDTAPALAALNDTDGYIAISFYSEQASSGALISLDDLATVLPYWSGTPLMYLPAFNADGIVNIGTSPLVLQTWNVLTMNYKSDSASIRLNGTEIQSSASAKAYNFDRFSLNRRISSGAGGHNNYRQIFIASSGISDAENASVEGLMTQDLANAPS